MPRFTTIDDVIYHLTELEPELENDLTRDQLHVIVNRNRAGRYENITTEEIDAMYEDAMLVALGHNAA